ncbi:hypothetical protein CHS0354_031020 [Potamilus streckersoni]|uniref:Proteasome assembly chaperone 2 n=1 Tax=Potamilus streckersoni TaxID=2493646 RepID=A0AAE0TCW3_9BIVA|nr:hypothetical protein CHS0354_031020 [Potamilus streckersoni]
MFISSEDAAPKFEEKTLVLTSVSVGNVGQLSADLLISTLSMKRIGYIHHESILPMVGNDPFASVDATTCKIVTSCEVYESMLQKLVVIQQRAPFIKGKRPCFRNWLVQWIKENKFKMVVILTSTHAHERIDVQLQGSQFRYIASSQIEEQFGDVFKNLHHWNMLERRTKFPAPSPIDQPVGEVKELYLPGGGIAKSLFEDLCDAGVPTAMLLMFCAEGDNVQEAITLTDQLNTWLKLVDFHKKTLDNTLMAEPSLNDWKIPLSWKLFFGSRVDQTLFH